MAITKVTNSLVATNAIQGTLIADNAITSVHIAQNQVTAVQIPDGSIDSTQLANASVVAGKIAAGAIDQSSDFADGVVITAKIADANITTAKIANNAITSALIPDGSITDTQLGSGAFTMGTITTTGAIRGPASFTIDPATVGDNTGTVVIAGNLQIDGTTTTVNSTTLSVADLNITVASGAGNASAANNAGLTIAGAGATMLYQSSGDEFRFNKPLYVTSAYKTGTGATFVGQLTNSGGKLRLQSDANRDIEIGDTNAADIVYVDTSALSVGIGTSGPGRKLHIKDNGQIKLENTGTSAWAGLDIHTSVGTNNYDMYMGMLDSNGRFFIDVDSNGEDLTIVQGGKVGINYSDPKAKLHVRAPQNDTMITANAFAAFDGTGGDGIIIGARNSSPFTAYIQSGYTPNIGTSHHYPLSLNPHGGNVGVGIASPGIRFHVHSDSSSDIVKFENNNGSFILGKTANLASIDLASDAGMRIRHGSTESAYFSADDVVFNNGSVAQNFRVESNGNTHMFFVDGTNNHIMIGNSTHQPVSQHNNQAGIGYNGAIGQTQMATTGDNATLEIGKNQGTDGNLIVFRKQSNIIGNIGTQGDDITIGNDNVGLRFGYAGLSNIVPVDIDNNDLEDNIISLGHANARFKDLTMGGNVKCGRIENIGSTIRTNFHTAQKGFQVQFANGVANQKIKLILSESWWGDLTVRLTGTYSNQNMAGVLEKRYGTGSNPNGVQYSNESMVTASLGATADNFHIGDIIWDSGLSKYVIVITHRVSTGNTLAINVEGFCQASSDVADIEGFTVSSVYTTDTTAYGQQEKNPAFSAILASGQVVTGTNTNIGFANEIFDNTGSHSSGVFTAPVPGIYSFGANFLLYPFTTGIVNVRYIKNSTAQTTVQHGASNSSHTGVTLTHLLTLAQGDTVSIQVSGSSLTGSTSVYGGQTYWHGHLIG